jgi:uncharacterized protein involved in exopolysaccharide biosynthesis
MSGNNGLVKTSRRDVLNVLFRHKLMIVLIFISITGLVTVATCLRPPIYRAEAKLLIRLGRENLSVDPSVSGPTVNPYTNRDNEVNSELTILTSHDLAEDLVDVIGEDVLLGKAGTAGEQPGVVARAFTSTAKATKGAIRDGLVAAQIIPRLDSRSKAVRRVMRDFSAEVEKRTNIITASYETKDPVVAQKALDHLVNSYLARHIEVYSSQASPDFFESQAETLRVAMIERQEALQDFRARNGIADMPRQQEVLIEQVSSLKAQADDAAAKIGGYEARIAALREALDGRPDTRVLLRTTGKTNFAADAFKERLAELRLQETDLGARYPDTHRPLAQLREQIANIEAALADENPTLTEETTGVDDVRSQLQYSLEDEQTQMKAEQARLEVLLAQMGQQKEALAALIAQEVELADMVRDAELLEKEYREYRQNLQRARISTAMDVSNVSNISVVQPASTLPVPVRPNKPVDIVLGTCAALFLAVFLAFAVDHFDDSVRSREQIEKALGIPVLAVVTDKSFTSCT